MPPLPHVNSTIILRGFGIAPKLVLRGFSPGAPAVVSPPVRATYSAWTLDQSAYSAWTNNDATYSEDDI